MSTKQELYTMDVNLFFAERIYEKRKALGISQEKLALNAGIDRTYINDIEKGKRNISLNIAGKVAIALGTTISELLKDYNG